MYLRRPLFQGKDYIHQLQLIFQGLGTPTEDGLSFIENEAAVKVIRTWPRCLGQPFSRLVPGASSEALDLMSKMLTIDPRQRISIEEALEHPFVRNLHAEAQEPVADSVFDFTFESLLHPDPSDMENVNQDALQELVWECVLVYRPELGDFE